MSWDSIAKYFEKYVDGFPFRPSITRAESKGMKTQIDFDNNAAVGTHDEAAAIDTPTQLHEEFHYDSLDSLQDTIRQRIKDGEPFEKLIKELSRAQADELIAERLATFIALIRSARKPLLFLDCVWFLSGAALREGATIESLAKRHKCSKQAFQQAMERIAEKFKLFPKLRTQRSEEARANMREAYVGNL